MPGRSRPTRRKASRRRHDEEFPKEDTIEMDGVVSEALPNAMFRVKLENEHELLAYASGKMKQFRIRILLGDRVKVEISPYDMERARINYRYK